MIPYAVSIFDLYADKFNSARSMRNIKYVCGIYMKLFSLGVRTWEFSASVRLLPVIRVAPDPNIILQMIFNDICKVTLAFIPCLYS